MYTSLDQIGESTSNPFEGSANDVPITQMCDGIALELKEMLGETDLAPLRMPENEIVM
jgi:putative membrane protein